MIRILVATVLAAALLAAGWTAIGPSHPVFAAVAQMVLTSWAALTFGGRTRPLEQSWFDVGRREPALLRALGVGVFGRLLDVVGWNRLVTRERGFDGTRAGLAALDQHTRRSEAVHVACTAVGVALALAATVTGATGGAAWLLGSTIAVQLYPALLQRLVRARIQRAGRAARGALHVADSGDSASGGGPTTALEGR
ncbi:MULTISPECIES: hypothetical protein [unclassified Rathayibacter]|uniref:glycosyl-4,4'-diaponeurosporenoate acyltransferase CrtO family protein n=1 Tax=unclassified Rathayibacter TaxID=2609250 RepID=UPI000CE8EF96|nr:MULTISPECIES: hypothetical protein [unclassified Rathayibacter]PPF40710.1 hypothetical protein C5B93_03785 [Rathayibacter sp. AY1A2]PPG15345.1 hypothetical protein C5D36_09600 [Rathayibacter sp. AY1C6]PPH55812.1 hypothetical protein C5C67_02890 [Rathayibacter sp. AY1E1]PPH86534.1 hypothetical protein C5C82_10850 [Rathayibacter sp. AY1D5]